MNLFQRYRAGKVKPIILQFLMRHASIHTTLAYYLDQGRRRDCR